MQHKRAVSIACLVVFSGFMKPVQADVSYSVASLRYLCGHPTNDLACKAYLHGVVETWSIKDIVSTEPNRYVSHGNRPAFCDTINKVSDGEWVNIVARNLNSMGDGPASDAVMKALSRQLCQQD